MAYPLQKQPFVGVLLGKGPRKRWVARGVYAGLGFRGYRDFLGCSALRSGTFGMVGILGFWFGFREWDYRG